MCLRRQLPNSVVEILKLGKLWQPSSVSQHVNDRHSVRRILHRKIDDLVDLTISRERIFTNFEHSNISDVMESGTFSVFYLCV